MPRRRNYNAHEKLETCCCGSMHIKAGAFAVGIVHLVLGVLTVVPIVAGFVAPRVTYAFVLAIPSIVVGLIHICIGVCAVIGMKSRQPAFLVVALVLEMVLIGLLLLWLLAFVIVTLAVGRFTTEQWPTPARVGGGSVSTLVDRFGRPGQVVVPRVETPYWFFDNNDYTIVAVVISILVVLGLLALLTWFVIVLKTARNYVKALRPVHPVGYRAPRSHYGHGRSGAASIIMPSTVVYDYRPTRSTVAPSYGYVDNAQRYYIPRVNYDSAQYTPRVNYDSAQYTPRANYDSAQYSTYYQPSSRTYGRAKSYNTMMY